MKYLKSFIPFVAISLLASHSSLAQSSQRQRLVQVADPFAANAEPVKKIRVLEFSQVPLNKASEEIQKEVEKSGGEPLNVIFKARAEQLIVPELVVRNVTGPDALRLVVTAAGAQLDEIVGDESIIGYTVQGPVVGTITSLQSRQYRPVAANDLTPPPSAVSRGNNREIRVTSSVQKRTPVVEKPMTPMAGRLGMFGGQPSAPTITRVYALAAVTQEYEMKDVEKTLLEILEASELTEGVKLALHDKTSVLVVRANDEVHGVVEQFLESLTVNMGDSRDIRNNREMEALRHQARRAEEIVRSIQEQLQREKAARMELEKQLQTLPDAAN